MLDTRGVQRDSVQSKFDTRSLPSAGSKSPSKRCEWATPFLIQRVRVWLMLTGLKKNRLSALTSLLDDWARSVHKRRALRVSRWRARLRAVRGSHFADQSAACPFASCLLHRRVAGTPAVPWLSTSVATSSHPADSPSPPPCHNRNSVRTGHQPRPPAIVRVKHAREPVQQCKSKCEGRSHHLTEGVATIEQKHQRAPRRHWTRHWEKLMSRSGRLQPH